MRKIIFRCILAITLLASCKKNTDISYDNSTTSLSQRVHSYLDSQMTAATGINAERLREVVKVIDFSRMRKERFSDKMDIIIAPVDIDVNTFKSIGNPVSVNTPQTNSIHESAGQNNTYRNVVFFIRDNAMVDANIIEVSSAVNSRDYLENNFAAIIKAERTDFSGHLNINSLQQKLVNDYHILNGKVRSTTIMKRSKPGVGNTGNIALQSNCTAWYLETTYYYSDGTISVSREYLGVTCDEESIAPQGDGSGGGSGISDPICVFSNSLSSNTLFNAKIAALKDSSSLAYERGYTFIGSNSRFFSAASATPNQVYFTFPDGPVDGLMHNHYSGLVPFFSPEDIQTLYGMAKNNFIRNVSSFTYTLVPPDGGAPLVIQITDVSALLSYGDTFLIPSAFANWRNSIANFGLSSGMAYSDHLKNLLCIGSTAGFSVYEKDTSLGATGWQKVVLTNNDTEIKKQKCTE